MCFKTGGVPSLKLTAKGLEIGHLERTSSSSKHQFLGPFAVSFMECSSKWRWKYPILGCKKMVEDFEINQLVVFQFVLESIVIFPLPYCVSTSKRENCTTPWCLISALHPSQVRKPFWKTWNLWVPCWTWLVPLVCLAPFFHGPNNDLIYTWWGPRFAPDNFHVQALNFLSFGEVKHLSIASLLLVRYPL